MPNSKSQNVGLALGGGAVLGAVHIGVLKALEESKYNVRWISGTSIGAFVAALYAFDHNASEIEEIASELSWFDISKIAISKMGILSNSKLGDVLADIIGEKLFEDASIPLAIVASDIVKGEKIVIDKGDVTKAVMASTCIPGIFSPIEFNERLLVDGGIIENIPISPLKEMGAEKIISVDLTQVTNIEPNSIFDVLMNAFNIALNNAAQLQQGDADVVLAPDLTQFNMVDTRQIPKLIEEGYRYTKEQIKAT
jgi:NTE family protein